jgi:hypothetical protein
MLGVCRVGAIESVVDGLEKFSGSARDEVGRGGISNSRQLCIFYGEGNVNHHLGTEFFVCNRIILAVKRVDFVIGCHIPKGSLV